jgi:Phasin protein
MERKMTADAEMKVPQAAREFVKRAASEARERAADTRVGLEEMTAAIENAAGGSVNEAVKIGRAIQNAVYEEVDALLDGIEQLASAKSFGEAFHEQSDYFHGRAAATTARGWAIINYVSELVLEAAKFANKKSSANAQVQTQAV